MAILIAPAALGATNSSSFVARTRRHVTVFCVPALTAAEVATIQISNDNGITWINTTLGTISVTNTTRTVLSPGLYRVAKGASVTATAVYAASEDNA